MNDQHQFHVKLPTQTRQELAELAAEAGLSSADIIRISLKWLLRNPDRLLRLEPEQRPERPAA